MREKQGLFVELIIALIMSYSMFKDFLYTIWSLPIMVILVVVVNLYFNAITIGYKLKSKKLKLAWAFISPFDNTNNLAKYIYLIPHSGFRKVTKKVNK